MKLLFKYPSRSRPDLFFRGLDSIVNNLADKENYIVLCTFDENDSTMNNPAIIEKLKTYKNLIPVFGKSDGKIHAMNKDIELLENKQWDILIGTSDDMEFITNGFDDIIRDDMKKYFPDGDGVLHYPDGYTDSRLMTISIMGRKYYDRFGYIYHYAYKSFYADNEAAEVGANLKKIQYIPKQLFVHRHPAWGAGTTDALYQRNDLDYVSDGAVYEIRKMSNFK